MVLTCSLCVCTFFFFFALAKYQRSKLLASYVTTVSDLTPICNRTFDRLLTLELSPEIRHMVPSTAPELRIMVTRHDAVGAGDIVPFSSLYAAPQVGCSPGCGWDQE